MSQNGDPSTEPIGTPPERETSDLDLFADAAEPASSDLSENGRENRPLPSEPPLPREEVEVETIGPERLSLAPGKLRSDYLRHTIQTGVFGLIATLGSASALEVEVVRKAIFIGTAALLDVLLELTPKDINE